MIVHQFVIEVKWNLEIVRLNVFIGVKEDIVRSLVVSCLLLLRRYINCNLNSLFDISNCSIEFECPLRVFRNVVSLTH